jgi:drug/metabolite transporter (DMT)-like permease
MALVLLLYALFASVFTISKTALEFTQPLFLIGSRMIFAGLIMLVYQFLRHRKDLVFTSKDLWRFFFLGLFNIYLANAFEFWGLRYLTSFKTCFIYSLCPFLSALLCYILFKENLTAKKWVGLLVGFLGMAPILLSQTSSEEQLGHIFLFSWAELSVMMAAICSVYGWILLGQIINESKHSPLTANGFSMLVGGVMALSHSYIVEKWDPLPISSYVPFFECAIALLIVSNLIAYNLYGHLFKKFTATFLSFAGFSTPLFTALFGWFFLDEVPSFTFYISAGIVFTGLVLFYQEELKQGYRIPTSAKASS